MDYNGQMLKMKMIWDISENVRYTGNRQHIGRVKLKSKEMNEWNVYSNYDPIVE